MKGFHEVGAYPEVRTRPGLLVYRFDADYLFFNVDSLKDRILARVAAADVPVEWIILDLSPVTWIDVTAVLKLRELREYLEAQSVFFALARVKPSIWRRFEHAWVDERRATLKGHVFDTLKTAVHAFEHRDRTNPKLADEAKPEP
jgi:MFS superfamily sulfate permease-like transporter